MPQFKIILEGTSKPPVWRRILIAPKATFLDLHHAIQGAFGWMNSHLWEFSDGNRPSEFRIGPPSPWEEDPDLKMAGKVQLKTVFPGAKQLTYLYDFGDSWHHRIVWEKEGEPPAEGIAVCLAGKGNCPPEDCGGVWGYYDLVEAINDPRHENHADMMEWMQLGKGDKWDVHAFDLEQVNGRIRYFLG